MVLYTHYLWTTPTSVISGVSKTTTSDTIMSCWAIIGKRTQVNGNEHPNLHTCCMFSALCWHLFQVHLLRNVFRFLCHLDIIFRNPSTLLVFCWFLSGRLKTLRHLQKMELCTFPKSVVFPWHGVRWTWFCVFYLSLSKKPFKLVFRPFHMGFPHFESSQSGRGRGRGRERMDEGYVAGSKVLR